MGVPGVREGRGRERVPVVLDKSRGPGHIVHVAVVVAAAVDDEGALAQAHRGGHPAAAQVLGVVGQGVAPAQHQGHALTDWHRLEQLHHVRVRGAQNADVVNEDDDITWGMERDRERELSGYLKWCVRGRS